MAVEVSVVYEGGLNCRATHGPSGATMVTTAPTDNGGDGSRFSPTDLVATAFSTCVMTIMALAAERHGIELRGMTARIEKHMSDSAPRRIARLPLVIDIPIELPERERTIIERAGRGCPVHRSFDDEVDASITYRWGQASAGIGEVGEE